MGIAQIGSGIGVRRGDRRARLRHAGCLQAEEQEGQRAGSAGAVERAEHRAWPVAGLFSPREALACSCRSYHCASTCQSTRSGGRLRWRQRRQQPRAPSPPPSQLATYTPIAVCSHHQLRGRKVEPQGHDARQEPSTAVLRRSPGEAVLNDSIKHRQGSIATVGMPRQRASAAVIHGQSDKPHCVAVVSIAFNDPRLLKAASGLQHVGESPPHLPALAACWNKTCIFSSRSISCTQLLAPPPSSCRPCVPLPTATSLLRPCACCNALNPCRTPWASPSSARRQSPGRPTSPWRCLAAGRDTGSRLLLLPPSQRCCAACAPGRKPSWALPSSFGLDS